MSGIYNTYFDQFIKDNTLEEAEKNFIEESLHLNTIFNHIDEDKFIYTTVLKYLVYYWFEDFEKLSKEWIKK
jgi:arginine deiminase